MPEFTISNFERHIDGYFHARVVLPDGKRVYLHRRYGSWMAPGSVNGNTVLKEPESLGVPHEAKVELARRAKATERKERGDVETSDSDRGSEPGDDASGETDD